MNAFVALSRKACVGLVGSLVVAASLVRGGMNEAQPACPTTTTPNKNVTPTAISKCYKHKQRFQVQLVFAKKEYDDFANQKAYICYTKAGHMPVKWEHLDKQPLATPPNAYTLYVKALRPSHVAASPQDKDRDDHGPGKGRIIVTDGRYPVANEKYYVYTEIEADECP
jgi:hypothetical protein